MNISSTSFEPRDEYGRTNKNTLVARAGVARTFGGLGGFLALVFLGAGIYLLQEALGDPVRAQAVGLIAGAFIIALSTILLYFIFSPRPGYRRGKIRQRSRSRAPQSGTEGRLQVEQPMEVALVLPPPASSQENHADLALPA